MISTDCEENMQHRLQHGEEHMPTSPANKSVSTYCELQIQITNNKCCTDKAYLQTHIVKRKNSE